MNLLPAWPLDLKTCLPLFLALPGLASPALWAQPSPAQGTGQATAANSPKQIGDAEGAAWLARLAPSGQALDRALVERLLAEIDLDHRATNNLAVAQSRAAALEQRLASAWQNPSDAEAGQLWRQAFLLKSDLALAAGDSASAWLAWNSRQPRPDAEPALAEAARAMLIESSALERKEALRLALLETLGAGNQESTKSKGALEAAIDTSLRTYNLEVLHSLGRSSVPYLRHLAGQQREVFALEGQLDPLRAYSTVDPLGALAYLHAEFANGGQIWRSRVADRLFGILNGRQAQPLTGMDVQLADELLLRCLLDPATSEPAWYFLGRNIGAWTDLPTVVAHVAQTVAEADGPGGLLEVLHKLLDTKAIRSQGPVFCSTKVDELRLAFVKRWTPRVGVEIGPMRVAILGLSKDPLPELRKYCAEALERTNSQEERTLRLNLLSADPDPQVRATAFLALVTEDDRERKTPQSPLGRPLDEPATWEVLRQLSWDPSELSEGCWSYAVKYLPADQRVPIWYRLLANEQETVLRVALESWSEVDFGSVEERGRAFVALWKRTRDLPNWASHALDQTGFRNVNVNRELLDLVLTQLAAEGENELVQRLIWSELPGDNEDMHRLADLAKQAGPSGRLAMLKAHAQPGVHPGALAMLLENLGPFDGEVLFEIAQRTELAPAMRLVAASQALSQGVVGAQAPLEESLGSPELAADFRQSLEFGKAEWAWYVKGRLERCPANTVNAVALNLLSRGDVPDSNLLFVVSTLGRLGAGSAEIARLCVARWGQDFSREQWERGGLRFALLAVGPERAFFDLDFVTRALQVPEYRDEAAQALGRRRDPANLPLLAQELERFAFGTLKYQQSSGYFIGLVSSVAQIGTPAALALLADTAAAAENNDQRKFCLAQIDQMLRVEEARRVAAEQGSLPRSRIAATGELLGMLSHADPKVRLAAIKGLGALGQPEVLPELIALLPGATPEFESAINAAIDLIAEVSARSAKAAPGLTSRPGTDPEQAAEPTPGEER